MKLTDLTISKARKGLQDRSFSSQELLTSCFKRIEKHDPKIQAFLTLDKNNAFKKAREADKLISKNKNIFAEKPLLGIPYSAKDVFCTKGVKTTASSNILKNYIPQYAATSIKKLDQAGAILLGKTNCDAFGFGSSTENSDFQVTKNPWNLNKVPGGSSGGSAAAVASSMGLFSIAEDTGGSIRQPASFCSVSGIKVTYGRVSRFGVIAYGSSLDTIGTMGKEVEDLALTIKVIAGQDLQDATTPDQEVPDYVQNLKTLKKDLKIGLPQEYFDQGLDRQVKEAVEKAAATMKTLKAQVVPVSLPHTKYAVAAYYLAGISEVSANLARYDGIRFGEKREEFGPEVKRRIMLGTYALSSGYYEAYYKKAMQVRTLLKADFDKVFAKVDCLFAPVSPFPAFAIGEKSQDPLAMWLADVYTVTINPAGVPALAVPCGFTNDNLPIGMQIIGPQFSEQLLFQVGHAYQKLTDYHQRRPKLND